MTDRAGSTECRCRAVSGQPGKRAHYSKQDVGENGKRKKKKMFIINIEIIKKNTFNHIINYHTSCMDIRPYQNTLLKFMTVHRYSSKKTSVAQNTNIQIDSTPKLCKVGNEI